MTTRTRPPQTTPAAEEEEPTTEEPSSDPHRRRREPPDSAGGVVGVYFAGDTPAGPRLYREFLPNTDGIEPIAFAVDTSLSGAAQDPDYGSLWPSGVSATEVGSGDGAITVRLSGAPADLPSGMTKDEAKLALQQVVYSAQAALGEGRVPAPGREPRRRRPVLGPAGGRAAERRQRPEDPCRMCR